MPYDKEKDIFIYQYWELRSINLAYAEKGKDALYDGGIDFYRRGMYLYTLLEAFSIAEFIADYERGCKYIGRNPRKRMGAEYIKRMVGYLNEYCCE